MSSQLDYIVVQYILPLFPVKTTKNLEDLYFHRKIVTISVNRSVEYGTQDRTYVLISKKKGLSNLLFDEMLNGSWYK